MNTGSLCRPRAAWLALWLIVVVTWVGCGDNEPAYPEQVKPAGGGAAARGSGGKVAVGTTAAGGAGIGGLGTGGFIETGATVAGATGIAGAATSAVTGAPSAGAGNQACSTPPAASRVVGWAAVAGNGLETTTGGGDATPLVVKSFAELQTHVAGTLAEVIYVQGVIAPGNLIVGSNKTIVGLCGAELHGHVHLSGSVNVVLRNIKVVGYGVGDCTLDPSFDATVGCSSGNDAISVLNNAHHIYIDHCDISDGTDGNLDITNGADFVSVSYTKFHYSLRTDLVGNDATGQAGHRFSNLVGGTDTPTYSDATSLNVTWHHNWWADGVMQRMPRVRFGKNHLFNNLYTSTGNGHCVRAGIQGQILIENTVFRASNNPQQFNSTTDQKTANITASSSENLYLGTTGTIATGGGGPAFTTAPYPYQLDLASEVEETVKRDAGPQ